MRVAFLQGDHTEVVDYLRKVGPDKEFISYLPGCSPPGKVLSDGTIVESCAGGDGKPVLASCADDKSNLDREGDTWGCYQNNHFMSKQPVQEPQPPGPPKAGQQINLIQGTCVS
jgi:hypothetical protein